MQALHRLFELPADALFDHIEETVIREAFTYCQRNQVQTAKLSGLSRVSDRCEARHSRPDQRIDSAGLQMARGAVPSDLNQ